MDAVRRTYAATFYTGPGGNACVWHAAWDRWQVCHQTAPYTRPRVMRNCGTRDQAEKLAATLATAVPE